MIQKGFDSELYMEKQTKHILERIEQFDNKLYLEFGGKLFDDYHAARVLPGFDVNAKIKLLEKIKSKAEIIFCINADHIEKNKIRADFGITYDMEVLRLIDNIRALDIQVNSIVITQYSGQPSADMFRKKLEMKGEKAYIHTHTKGYPDDVSAIVSDEGYGANPYIETTMPLVVVTAPGPCSGKLATCLSQVYHEHKRNIKAGYAKFETFPIWNMPLRHPVNLAYEAATADLGDVNMIDPFHLDAYGETTVNYNRDVEVFPIVKTILSKISSQANLYKSPTDMGVNMAGYCVTDDQAVREASNQEIIRRYYRALCDYKKGIADKSTLQKIQLIMSQLEIKPEYRKVIAPALEKEKEKGFPAVAIMLNNGKIITGRSSKFMNAASSALLNSIKELSGVADEILLISPVVIEPILKLKESLGTRKPVLDLEEMLIALSICGATNPTVELVISNIGKLKNCEAHSTSMLSHADEGVFRKLGVNLTCEGNYSSKDLFSD